MLRVAVLGAGFPGLIVADTLQQAGHTVEVFGRHEQAGVLSGMGPRHLWDNVAFKQAPALIADAPRVEVPVRWLHRDRLQAVTVADNDAVDTFYRGYWMKARGAKGGKPPCRGVSVISVIEDGYRRLTKAFDLDRFEAIPSPVIEVNGKNGFTIKVDGGQSFDGYDRVVTTLLPRKFSDMARAFWYVGEEWGNAIPQTTKVCYYWGDHLCGIVQSADLAKYDGSELMVYSGEPHVWWYRASRTPKGWCHETLEGRGPKPGDWKGEYSEAYTQVSAFRGTFSYPIGVVPVGRYAEWDSEAMVDTVYERRAEYLKAIEGPIRGWRLDA